MDVLISNSLLPRFVSGQKREKICKKVRLVRTFCFSTIARLPLFKGVIYETITAFFHNEFKAVNLIDVDGYRPNVGIVICNQKGQVLWAKRLGQNSWQFPQGGINEGESIETAMYRELFEEVGLQKKDVRLIWASKYWLKYKLPKRLIRYEGGNGPVCIGQKQRWFLLQLLSPESTINLKATKTPEFDGWRWVSFWYPVRQVVSFKRDVYRKVMKEFAQVLMNSAKRTENNSRYEQNEKVVSSRSETDKKSSSNSGHHTRKPYRNWYSRRKA